MAKISAHGAYAVAAVNASAEMTDAVYSTAARRLQVRFVLRSDRVILRRFRGPNGTGYKRFGKLKPTATADAATLRRIVTACGYTPE